MSDTESKVIQIIAEHLDITEDSVRPVDSFLDVGADSLDIVEIIMAVEEEFGMEIPDAECEKIKTVTDLINYVQIAVQKRGGE